MKKITFAWTDFKRFLQEHRWENTVHCTLYTVFQAYQNIYEGVLFISLVKCEVSCRKKKHKIISENQFGMNEALKLQKNNLIFFSSPVKN